MDAGDGFSFVAFVARLGLGLSVGLERIGVPSGVAFSAGFGAGVGVSDGNSISLLAGGVIA